MVSSKQGLYHNRNKKLGKVISNSSLFIIFLITACIFILSLNSKGLSKQNKTNEAKPTIQIKNPLSKSFDLKRNVKTISRNEKETKNQSNKKTLNEESNNVISKREVIKLREKVKVNIPSIYSEERAKRIMRPLFSCYDENYEEGRDAKLIFVHIFKTAGSTMRSLFRLFARECRVGYATVVSCAGLTKKSIREGKWRKDNGSCLFKKGVSREGEDYEPHPQRINSTFIENNIEILGGHLPLGAGEEFKKRDGLSENIRYFTFLRDSVDKYISGRTFSNRHNNLTFVDLVTLIKLDVTKARQKNEYFQNYASYLITPFQRELSFDRDTRTELILQNLVDHDIVIGMVDRMSESLELLSTLIDPKKEIKSLFHFFGMKNEKGRVKSGITYNKSMFSTSDIKKELQKDEAFFSLLLEYVKYDQMIVDFARKIHLLQYQVLQQVKIK